MGWNSWDAYGKTLTEAQFRANVRWMAKHLRRYGWRYAVIDAGWSVPAGGARAGVLRIDRYGRYLPAPDRFPSAAGARGFGPLAHYVHSLGLKFGIHIMRGIPKEAVRANLPIAGSPFHARQAADLNAPCSWDPNNDGVADNAAG
ncbi:alpha-galactosidase, partial [mine drainage metagenome]